MENPYSYKKFQWPITARPRICTQAQADDAGVLTAEETTTYSQAFARYDLDDSGSIDPTEMMQLLEEQTGKPHGSWLSFKLAHQS